MNLADLQAFIQIYQTKNISRAAEQLNMTQSALSKRLHTIQNIVGVTLVSTQNRRQLEITEAGESFYRYAKLITTQYSLMQTELQEYQTLKRGSLLIGTVPILSQYGLMQALTKFMADYPQINLRLQELEGDQLVEKLQTNSFDIAIVRDLQTEHLNKSYQSENLYRDQLMVILPVTHPLAQKKEISMTELADFEFTLLPPGSGVYEQVISLCEHAGFTPNVRFESTHIETILSVVENSQQVTLLFQRSAVPFMTTKLNLRPLTTPIFSELQLISPRQPRNAAINQFLRYLRAAIQ